MVEIIEGTWEDLAERHSHAPVNHFVDDSRESIYSGTIDDPR